jgi:hypothetical protein
MQHLLKGCSCLNNSMLARAVPVAVAEVWTPRKNTLCMWLLQQGCWVLHTQ